MNGRNRSNSKQLGKIIGTLIGAAREVERLESGHEVEDKPLAAHATRVLVQTVREQGQEIAKLKNYVVEVRRQKLANFSLDEIARELERRKLQAFKLESRTRRAKNST